MPQTSSRLVLPPLACLLVAVAATAQMREDQQPVMTPPLAPQAAAPPDAAPIFARIYRQAGSPRIVLLWNRSLRDKLQTDMVDKTVVHEKGQSSGSGSLSSTQGEAGSASLRQSDNAFERTRVETRSRIAADEPAARIHLAERHALALERAFVAEMGRAGVKFVDRTLAMRSTAAMRHRAGGDALLVETDALLQFGDLLLEVAMVEDKDAPAGLLFDVRVKHLKAGSELASVLTRATPAQPQRGPGRWVAGAEGYEFRLPPGPSAPTPMDIGATLARDVMAALAGGLAGR